MAHPRFVTRGAMVGITRRATLRKAFLAPWHELVGQTWAYLLAYAQQQTGVELHHASLVANHQHMGATANDYLLDLATWYLHRDFACVLNNLLEAEGYDSPGNVFDARRPSWTTCVDAEAEEKRILYDSMNAVAAGFVERPEQMPFGHHFGIEHWLQGPLTIECPDVRYLHKRPKRLPLTFTPPAKLYRAEKGDMVLPRRLNDGA
ncbi:MAG: hypothetical protein KF901_11455 [Myxococcales bacterium]|nr:hypothetical protein [Myxococcales bacterium]